MTFARSLRLSVPFLLLNLNFLVTAPIMHGQTTGPGPFDPGPRNPGTKPFAANCPLPTGTPLKFASPGIDCIDFDQPPSSFPNPLTDGVGNLIGETTLPNGGGFAQPLFEMWFQGISIFQTVASVTGSVTGESLPGLGPSFNAQSCGHCHSQPAVGGSSPGIITISTLKGTQIFTSFEGTSSQFTENPEIQDAKDQDATNVIPIFGPITVSGPGFATVPANGPVIEVRFVNGLPANGNAAAVQPNGVGELFTFQGRLDEPQNGTPKCSISQLTFTASTLAFRIPTPTFGLGLAENTPELTLQLNLLAEIPNNFGITGSFNRSGNDGTITRFGWKAQNKSLLIFAGEASNVEMGVTNELFPDEKTWGNGLNCIPNNQPEDQIFPAQPPPTNGDASVMSSVAQNNAVFMRMNGAPSQCDALLSGVTSTGVATCIPFGPLGGTNGSVGSPQVIAGQTFFGTVGCALCHSPTLTTAPSVNAALSNQTYHPYSDFALHHMGAGVSDGTTQGLAGPDQFRTAPLWGLGQRYFFFHDGRATDLPTAIQDHCPTANQGVGEACLSVKAFNGLSETDQQDILDFLRSL
jgi:CxxC motif-containing protein (DUF1111 family)